jgi:hypothetical protein
VVTLNVISNPVDDVSRSIGIVYDAAQGFPDFTQLWRLLVQKIQGRTGVVACCGDRLLDVVSNRSRELTQSRYATDMRKIGFALPQCFLGALALS